MFFLEKYINFDGSGLYFCEREETFLCKLRKVCYQIIHNSNLHRFCWLCRFCRFSRRIDSVYSPMELLDPSGDGKGECASRKEKGSCKGKRFAGALWRPFGLILTTLRQKQLVEVFPFQTKRATCPDMKDLQEIDAQHA